MTRAIFACLLLLATVAPSNAGATFLFLNGIARANELEAQRKTQERELEQFCFDTNLQRVAKSDAGEDTAGLDEALRANGCASLLGPGWSIPPLSEECALMDARLRNAASDGITDDALASRFKRECIDGL